MLLLRPAILLMNRFNLAIKIALIAAILLFANALSLGDLVRRDLAVIDLIDGESQGVNQIEAVIKVMTLIQQHRGLWGGLLNGDASCGPRSRSGHANLMMSGVHCSSSWRMIIHRSS